MTPAGNPSWTTIRSQTDDRNAVRTIYVLYQTVMVLQTHVTLYSVNPLRHFSRPPIVSVFTTIL